MFIKNYGMSFFEERQVDGKGWKGACGEVRKVLFMRDVLNGCSLSSIKIVCNVL